MCGFTKHTNEPKQHKEPALGHPTTTQSSTVVPFPQLCGTVDSWLFARLRDLAIHVMATWANKIQGDAVVA